MPDNPTEPTTPLTPAQLQGLQDGINTNIQIVLKAYDQCSDPAASASLISQSKQLSEQMDQIETALFHQQTGQASVAVAAAFTSAMGFTAELTAQAQSLGQVTQIIATAAKVIGAVAQIIPYL
jgi:hypothetical protein